MSPVNPAYKAVIGRLFLQPGEAAVGEHSTYLNRWTNPPAMLVGIQRSATKQTGNFWLSFTSSNLKPANLGRWEERQETNISQ